MAESDDPRRPVRIAGSGPAGLAAAIPLARSGRRVELHERRNRAGGRFQGGHQILAHYGERPWAADLLGDCGIDVAKLEGRWLRAARFHLGHGGHRDCTSRRPFAYLLRRGPDDHALDGALLSAARGEGVEVFESSRLDVADVVATGPHRVDGMALEVLYEADLEDRVDVVLDPSTFGAGYAYLLVHDHHATLGVAALRDYENLESMIGQSLDRILGPRAGGLREHARAKHTMCYGVPDSGSRDQGLRVGEAAGFQDFLFGLGIRNALFSGRLAAECIENRAEFDRLWRRRLLPRMRASEVDRWLYERGWLGWLLEHAPRGHLDRNLDWLHRGSRARAFLAKYLRSRD